VNGLLGSTARIPTFSPRSRSRITYFSVSVLFPAPGGPAAQQVFGNERAVKFNILPTGTTLGAGFANASNDPVTHNTFSADQKLYGPLHVTTAVTDVGQITSNKSVTAGFKLNW